MNWKTKVLALNILAFMIIGCSKEEERPELEENKTKDLVPELSGLVEMVLIPSGTHQIGNTGAYSGSDDEKPVHTVTISRSFYMGKYEVTQAQYEAVMGTNPSDLKGDNLPVEQVSWFDAVEFCNRLSVLQGLEPVYSGSGDNVICDWNGNGYRLPTEAEWEYAAKAGTTTDFYSGSLTHTGSSQLDPNLDKIGWYSGNAGGKTYPVGQKEPNEFGLYDMSGNVWEWCWDWWGNYNSNEQTAPEGPKDGVSSVLRGGSWFNDAEGCRSSYRIFKTSDYSSNYIGFRLVKKK